MNIHFYCCLKKSRIEQEHMEAIDQTLILVVHSAQKSTDSYQIMAHLQKCLLIQGPSKLIIDKTYC